MEVYIGNRSNSGAGSGLANSLLGALAASHPLLQGGEGGASSAGATGGTLWSAVR